MQKGPPFRGDRRPIGTPEQRVHTGFHDSWKPRLGCWSWRRLQRSAARFLSKASPQITVHSWDPQGNPAPQRIVRLALPRRVYRALTFTESTRDLVALASDVG